MIDLSHSPEKVVRPILLSARRVQVHRHRRPARPGIGVEALNGPGRPVRRGDVRRGLLLCRATAHPWHRPHRLLGEVEKLQQVFSGSFFARTLMAECGE